MTRLIACGLALCALLATSARADDPLNAATWYRRAIEQIGALSPSDRELIESWDGSSGAPPSNEVRAAIGRAQSALEAFRRGSQQSYNDFGLDLGVGPELLLPHLGPLRGLARIARADSYLRLFDGDAQGAAANYAALYRSARQMGEDSILISSLVGQAIYSLADGCVQEAFDRAQFSEGEANTLFKAINGFGESDPFATVDAISSEQVYFGGWLADQLRGAEDPMVKMAELSSLVGRGEIDPEFAALAAGGEEGIDTMIASYDDLMTQVTAAYSNPDRAAGLAQLKTLEEQVAAGDFGPLSKLMAPSFSRIHERATAAMESIDARRAMLEGIVSGEVAPEAEANALLYYMGATEHLKKIEAPRRNAVLAAIRAATQEPLPDDVMETLAGAEAIYSAVLDGTTKRRCRFNIVRGSREAHDFVLAWPDVVALQDLLDFLRADARRRLQQGDRAGGAAQLAVGFRVLGHFSADTALLSPALWHAHFRLWWALTADALDNGLIREEDKAALADALESIPRRDPFGHVAGIEAQRAIVSAAFSRALPPATEHRKLVEVIGKAPAAQIAQWHALFCQLRRSPDSNSDASGRALLPSYAPIVNMETLSEIEGRASSLGQSIALGDITAILEMPVCEFAPLDRLRREARRDLRAALMRLRPPQPDEPPTPDDAS